MALGKLFNRFKKDKSTYDPTNLSVRDLDKKWIVEYFMESYEVKECYRYDWGNNFFSKEYKLYNGRKTIFLHVEEEEDLTLSISEEASIMSIDKNLKSDIIADDKPAKTIVYKNKTYYLNNENQGYFQNLDEDFQSEFVSWEFTDENEEEFISISRWGETDFSAAVGKYVKEYEFSNILPAEN
jgi:hypothetical protein